MALAKVVVVIGVLGFLFAVLANVLPQFETKDTSKRGGGTTSTYNSDTGRSEDVDVPETIKIETVTCALWSGKTIYSGSYYTDAYKALKSKPESWGYPNTEQDFKDSRVNCIITMPPLASNFGLAAAFSSLIGLVLSTTLAVGGGRDGNSDLPFAACLCWGLAALSSLMIFVVMRADGAMVQILTDAEKRDDASFQAYASGTAIKPEYGFAIGNIISVVAFVFNLAATIVAVIAKKKLMKKGGGANAINPTVVQVA